MEIVSRSLAALMLINLSPLFLLISAGSLLFQGFPILFKQQRVGFRFNLFTLYKFRTMKINNDNKAITETGDRRITTWGKILRMLKLDELPQLWNIVKGEMRFVGPRPEVEHYVTKESFRFLNSVKPGLTDFSSILLRNEEQIIAHMGGVEKYPELLKIKVKLGGGNGGHHGLLSIDEIIGNPQNKDQRNAEGKFVKEVIRDLRRRDYFNLDNPDSRALRQRFSELADARVEVKVPDLSESLDALQAYLQRKHAQRRQGAAAAGEAQ